MGGACFHEKCLDLRNRVYLNVLLKTANSGEDRSQMKCPRCDLPVEPDESQCSVCGEILHSAGDRSAVFPKRTDNPPPKREPSAESRATSEEPLSFLAYNPSLTKYAIWWMVACAVFAALF